MKYISKILSMRYPFIDTPSHKNATHENMWVMNIAHKTNYSNCQDINF